MKSIIRLCVLCGSLLLLTGCTSPNFAHPMGGKLAAPEQVVAVPDDATAERDWRHYNFADSKDAYRAWQAIPHLKVMVKTAAVSEEYGPTLYPRFLVWDESQGASSYVVSVNGVADEVASLPLSAPIDLLAATDIGTNVISISAKNAFGESDPTTIGYLIRPHVRVGCDVVSAPSMLGPWSITNLPPDQIDPSGQTVYFRLQPRANQFIEENQIP